MKREPIEVTPAQKELLKLLEPKEAKQYYESLKNVYYLATYCVALEVVDLSASKDVYDLMEIMLELFEERT